MECINNVAFINLLIDMAYKAGKEGTRCPGFAQSETVTRCRDCNGFRRNATPNDPNGRDNFCCILGTDMDSDDGFCACAERRDDD